MRESFLSALFANVRSKTTPDHVTALIVAIASGLVLLAYKWVNPDKEAERHFLEHDNVAAYRVMEGCYIVILAAAAYNFRYLLFDLGKELFVASIASLPSTKSNRAAR